MIQASVAKLLAGTVLIVCITLPGQVKDRQSCRMRCARERTACVKAANGDQSKKEACEQTYRSCLENCANLERLVIKNKNSR